MKTEAKFLESLIFLCPKIHRANWSN